MKVLLVNPWWRKDLMDAVLPPLGLAFVAGAAQRAGYAVELLDLNLEHDWNFTMRSAIRRTRPDVVGISALTVNIKNAWAVAETVKQASPETSVMMGGVHPTLDPYQTLENPFVDYLVLGEGEETFSELLQHFENAKDVSQIPGIAFRTDEGIFITESRLPIDPLDSLPLPAYELFEMKRYSSPQCSTRNIGVMFTSRGCPYGCIFCDANVIHGRRYRFHSPERVLEEIDYLKRTFGVREVLFKDSEFTLNTGRIKSICELILRKGVRIKWSCNARVGSLDLPLLRKMKAAGCRLIQYGVESGDPSVLDTLRKGITVEQIEETFRLTRKSKIKTVANCMIGSPGETRAGVEETLALVKRIRTDYINVNFIAPYPGTELYRLSCENNWFVNAYDPMRLDQKKCMINATCMETHELKTMLDYVERNFYLRPKYIWKRLFSMNPIEWKKNLTGVYKLIALSNR